MRRQAALAAVVLLALLGAPVSAYADSSRGQNGPLAFTSPGSRLVFVCSRKFADLTFGDWDLARAVVIHEALHSLGLGENPPSSLEITARVRARCGRATDKGHR